MCVSEASRGRGQAVASKTDQSHKKAEKDDNAGEEERGERQEVVGGGGASNAHSRLVAAAAGTLDRPQHLFCSHTSRHVAAAAAGLMMSVGFNYFLIPSNPCSREVTLGPQA